MKKHNIIITSTLFLSLLFTSTLLYGNNNNSKKDSNKILNFGLKSGGLTALLSTLAMMYYQQKVGCPFSFALCLYPSTVGFCTGFIGGSLMQAIDNLNSKFQTKTIEKIISDGQKNKSVLNKIDPTMVVCVIDATRVSYFTPNEICISNQTSVPQTKNNKTIPFPVPTKNVHKNILFYNTE